MKTRVHGWMLFRGLAELALIAAIAGLIPVSACAKSLNAQSEASVEASRSAQYPSGNVSQDALGGTVLKNVRSVASGQAGVNQGATLKNELGEVSGQVTAGAAYVARMGDNGGEASVQIGLAAELKAVSEQLAVGNEDVGASVQASAKVEALIGAEGRIGAYIDDKGITIGAEAKAGAYISAEVEINFEAHVFGIQTNVHASAEGHAGLLAHGEATVTIGFDGRIKFGLGAGLSIGLGVSAAIEFDLDASELMERLGLTSLSDLIEWIDAFVEDPQTTLDQLVGQAGDAAVQAGIDAVEQGVIDFVDNTVLPTLDQIPVTIIPLPGAPTMGDVTRELGAVLFPSPLPDESTGSAQGQGAGRADSGPDPEMQAPPSGAEPGVSGGAAGYERFGTYKNWSE